MHQAIPVDKLIDPSLSRWRVIDPISMKLFDFVLFFFCFFVFFVFFFFFYLIVALIMQYNNLKPLY